MYGDACRRGSAAWRRREADRLPSCSSPQPGMDPGDLPDDGGLTELLGKITLLCQNPHPA